MPSPIRARHSVPGAADLVPLALGLAALIGGTLLGWRSEVVAAIVAPPPLIRALLAGGAAVVAGALLREALRRIAAGADGGRVAAQLGPGDLAGMIRGVRFVFLAVAAAAASIGWILGHPLPIVIALVIGGVDVVETSFLLLVVGSRRSTAEAPERDA